MAKPAKPPTVLATPHSLSLSRLENLSDGVFGLAMSLLVLGLGIEEAPTLLSGDLASGLATLTPRLLTLGLVMIGLGVFWVGHVGQLRYVTRPDRNLMFLNLLPLFFVVILPFTSAVLGHAWGSRRALLLVVANLALGQAAMALEWAYIVRLRARQGDPIDRETRRRARVRIAATYVVWGVVAVLAFLSPLAAVVAFVVSTVAYALPGPSSFMWRGGRRA